MSNKPKLKAGEKNLAERFKGDMERRSRYYSWLASNRYLRRVIAARIEASGVSRSEVARQIGVDRSRISHYLNNSKHVKALSDLQILKVCEFVGIEFSLEITKLDKGKL